MDPSEPRGVSDYLNLALVLPISTLVGFLLGYGLDMLFHTLWVRYVFLVLGVVAGFMEAFRVLTGKK